MTQIKIELEGTKELEQKLSQLSSAVRSAVALNAVYAGAAKVEEFTKINIQDTFSKRQTGGLANSVMSSAMQTGSGAEAYIEPIKVYARIQEFGGTVKPIPPNKTLRFQVDGQWRSAKQVTIPARPYLGPAVNDHKEEIIAAMAQEVELGIQQSV